MDYQLKMRVYKMKNKLRFLAPKHLRIIFPDISVRHLANRIWRGDNTLCNPKRKQFKI